MLFSVNIMVGGRGTLPSSCQATAVTTSNFVFEGASLAQEHVQRNTAVKVLQLHHVGGMKSTRSMVQGRLSPGTVVDLTWLFMYSKCEAAVCSSCSTLRN